MRWSPLCLHTQLDNSTLTKQLSGSSPNKKCGDRWQTRNRYPAPRHLQVELHSLAGLYLSSVPFTAFPFCHTTGARVHSLAWHLRAPTRTFEISRAPSSHWSVPIPCSNILRFTVLFNVRSTWEIPCRFTNKNLETWAVDGPSWSGPRPVPFGKERVRKCCDPVVIISRYGILTLNFFTCKTLYSKILTFY